MKRRRTNLLSFLFILASIVLVFFIAFSNQELSNAWEAFGSMDLRWVAGIFLCWCIYTGFDGLNYWAYLRRQGFKLSIGRAINVALIGFYYSNITPSAAGGQPMQVNSMRKAGIPVGYGTMAVTIRFITNQFMISFMSFLLFLLNRDFVYGQLQGAMWFVRFGWLINCGSVPLVLLAAFKRNWIQAAVNWIIRLLAKIHLVKNPDITIAKVTDILDTYHTALHDLMRHPGQILLQFGLSTVSLLGLMFSVVFVYHAFGQSGTPWYQLLTISFLLYVSASGTPLPGASGAQEGGFLLYYNNIFKAGTIGLALLVWRFFTFYLYLIVGIFTVILERMIIKKEAKAREAARNEKKLSESQDATGNEKQPSEPQDAAGNEKQPSEPQNA